MLKTLSLQGFRGFESYRLTDLSTVNLLVGKNDCGKTTVLEAVYLLASEGAPAAFYDIAERRNELNHRIESISVPSPLRYEVGVSPLFYGHSCRPGVRFALSSDDGIRGLSALILPLEEVNESQIRESRKTYVFGGEHPEFGLRLTNGKTQDPDVVLVDRNGAVLHHLWHRNIRKVAPDLPSVRFLGLESGAFDLLQHAWNEVVTEGREDEIVRDMSLLMPEIETIHFQTGYEQRGFGTILVGHSDGGRRMPLSAYGDGLRRLLAWRLAFVGLDHGFLLIDEVDAGMHWTVMEDVWRLIVEVARQSDTQVFATTHSYDCIRGLGSLMRSRPDLAAEVSMQKLHPSLEQAVSFTGEQIAVAVEQQIELR